MDSHGDAIHESLECFFQRAIGEGRPATGLMDPGRKEHGIVELV
jgi:hypothetical protein